MYLNLRGAVTAGFVAATSVLSGCGPSGGDELAFNPGEMPACNSDATKQLLTKAIQQSPLSKQGLELISIGQAAPYNAPSLVGGADFIQGTDGRWLCKAMTYTNAGKLEATFSMEWANDTKSQIWLEVSTLQPNQFSNLR